MTDAPKRTPLYALHHELGGKMVDFAGWEMPVQYPMGIMGEHNHTRAKAGLFDVSHMGQVLITAQDGPSEAGAVAAATALEGLVPQALAKLPVGKARYAFFTNERGGIMDDLIIANAGKYLFVVVNASMRHQDIPHMANHLTGFKVTEVFDRALIALQGPQAETVLATICPECRGLKFMETMMADIMGATCRVSRLGYTGEDGYEVSIPEDCAIEITKALLAHEDCEPIGLGARDSLRLEAGLCLYGNDIDNDTTPIEANLLWAIQKRRRTEGGFPGAEIIQGQIANGTDRLLVGIKPDGRAPARAGVEVHSLDGDPLGAITSGSFGPTIGGPVAMGYVARSHATAGSKVNLIIRGKAQPATITDMPFVTQNYKR